MDHTSGDLTAPGDGVFKRDDNKAGHHPGIDGVAAYIFGEHILEGTDVELSFTAPMVGDVSNPEFVRDGGPELVPDVLLNSVGPLPLVGRIVKVRRFCEFVSLAV